MSADPMERSFAVRGTQILATDSEQQRLQKLACIALDEMHQLVGVLDTDGTLLECNRAALEAGGLTRAEVIGKPFWETPWWMVAPQTQQELREAVRRAAQGEFIRHDVEVYARKGGNEIMLLDFTLLPVKDQDGRVVYLLLEVRDITEKKLLEGAIARNHIELQGLRERIRELEADALKIGQSHPPVAARPGAMQAMPARPKVLVVEHNVAMNRFIDECLAEDYHVISASDGREGLEQAVRLRPALVVCDIMMSQAGGVEMIAEMRRLPQLQLTPVLLLSVKADEELLVKLLDEGAQDFIVKPFSAKDLLVRVRNLILAQQAREQTMQSLAREHEAREEAELQKRLLHSLFMQAPTLIAVLRGPNHMIELANPPICQVMGRREQDVLNRPLFEAVPELRDQIFPALLDEVFRTGVACTGKETPTKVDRGSSTRDTIYFNFVYSPFRNIDGQIEGIFIIASEVTAQVLAREQINGLREAAEGANRAKDEFLAMLGHELRNPLSPIVTALQLMKLQGPEGSERARTVIERQVNHLIRLVDDLLDVSRIARGKVALKKEPVELADIVATAIEMVNPLLEQRAHTLIVDVPPAGLGLIGDATRLSQVVSNLLTNAAKYTPAAGRITVHAQAVGGEVVLRVHDTGIGIAPEVLPRIFDLFVQERQAIDRSQGGLGLGLAIVRNLIGSHGGTVSARSEGTGRGSEFIVRLPARIDAQPLAEAQPTVLEAVPGVAGRDQVPRILIVDDNEDAAAMLARVLDLKGYEIRVAHDAPAALGLATQFLPHVALLDIGLPVMDGYELAAHLRDIPELTGLQLIAVTGYGQESDRQRTRAAGFHHHLVKPVGVETLEAVMQLPTVR